MTHRTPSTHNGMQRRPQARVVGAQAQTARRETRDQGDQGIPRANLANESAAPQRGLRQAPRQPSVARPAGERPLSGARLNPLLDTPHAAAHDLPVGQSVGQSGSSDALIRRVDNGGGRPAYPVATAHRAHTLAQPPGGGETHTSSLRRVGSGFMPIGRFLTTDRESACLLPEASQTPDPVRDPVTQAATPASPASPVAQRRAQRSLSSPHEADPGADRQDRSGFSGLTITDGTTRADHREDHSEQHAPVVRQSDGAGGPAPQSAQVDVTAGGPAAAPPRAPFQRVGSSPQARVRGDEPTRDHEGGGGPAVAQRVAAARWVCPHCGVVEPHTLTILDLVLVRPGQCACQTEERQRHLARIAAVERANARDTERRIRYFGGLRPEDVAWRQRFETFEGAAGAAEVASRAAVADETRGARSSAPPVAGPGMSDVLQDVVQPDTGFDPSGRSGRSAERTRDVSLDRQQSFSTTGFTSSPGAATAAVTAVGATRHPDPNDPARERGRGVASLGTPAPGSVETAVAAVEDWVALLALVWDQARARARVESQDATGTIIAPMYASLTQTYALTALTRLPRLILLGPTGVGKTHLLVAAYHALIDHDIPVRYVPARGFLDALRHSWDTTRQRTAGGVGGSGGGGFGGDAGGLEEEVMRQLISTPVLLLDGLSGPQGSSGWAASRWARLFEERAQRGRPWAVAARSIDALAQAAGGDATLETICERACPVELQTPSHRAQSLLTPTQLHALRRSLADGMAPPAPLAARSVDRAARGAASSAASCTADGR